MDTRDWAKARRERTRYLIELRGLLTKSGLPELIAAIEPDDRAVILGALLELADACASRPMIRPGVSGSCAGASAAGRPCGPRRWSSRNGPSVGVRTTLSEPRWIAFSKMAS